MQKGQDRGGWVGWDSVAICGLSFGNTLVGTRWTVLCTNRLKKQSSHLVGPHIPSSEVFFFFPSLDERLLAKSRASLLMSGCGLSHECVGDDYEDSCMKFEG